MRQLALVIAAICFGSTLLNSPAQAEGEKAGDFDYYLMSLGWSSNWCAMTAKTRNATPGAV